MRRPPYLLLSILALLLSCAGSAETLTVRGYGIVDPARGPSGASALLRSDNAERVAQVDLRRLLLYHDGAVLQKTENGYAIADTGRLRETELDGEAKTLSPVLCEVSLELEAPARLTNRVMQVLQVSLSYTAGLNLKEFQSVKAYVNWVDDALVKALGDELVKKGWLKGGQPATLEFLHFERALGKKQVSAKLYYVVKR